MKYTIPFETANAGVNGAYKTVGAIIVPDTSLVRAQLTGFALGSADSTPFDETAHVRIGRILDLSAGGAGTGFTSISAVNVPKNDPDGPVCTCSGKVKYGTEPTAYEANPWRQFGLNDRGVLWSIDEGEESLIATQDMLIGLQVAGLDTTVLKWSGYLEFRVI